MQGTWPVGCALCGSAASIVPDARTGRVRFCTPCAASLPLAPHPRCAICASPLSSGAVCGACTREPPAYDEITVPFSYQFPLDVLVQRFKYGGELSLAAVLAAPLAHIATPNVDALIAMPLAPQRLRERGFNQAHEIARYVARKLALPLLAGAARKVTETAPQAMLPWTERARNIRNVFVCDADLSGMRVAIVDDVMTTGATINELARVLKRAGAARVSGWVVTRTLAR